MALRRADNEFEIIYNYYLDLKKNGGDRKCWKPLPEDDLRDDDFVDNDSLLGNQSMFSSKMFYYLVDFYGKNGFPQVVSDEAFGKIPEKELYHGFEYNRFAVNFIENHSYHYGNGMCGDGFYTTNSKDSAMCYTEQLGDFDDIESVGVLKDQSRILKLKLLSSKVLSFSELRKISDYYKDKLQSWDYSPEKPNISKEQLARLDEFIDFLAKTGDDGFIDSVMPSYANYTTIALMLGFDVVEVVHMRKEKELKTDYIVLNRGCVCIPESELDKFKQATEKEIKEILSRQLEVE